MRHLPVEESTPAQVLRLTAWLATFRGDLDAERRALERLVAVDSADIAALDRLAAIAEKEDQPDRAGEYHRRKTEIGRLRARYETLYQRNQTMRDAGEMAGLAERLSRPFEAKVFQTIAIAAESEHGDAIGRSSQDVPVSHPRKGTLADLLADELAAADRARIR